MKNLPAQVEHTIRTRNLFTPGEKILVAVSGGLDSMVLLHLLHGLASQAGWKLFVAHFNHQLRGRAGDADERWVRKSAKALALPFRSGTRAVKRFARRRGLSVEMAARELRHQFLARAAARFGCRVVALAHHADDQVELFFLRALRGTGGEALAGMKWRAPSPASKHLELVRPLLAINKDDLAAFAAAQRIHFREDASNASADILRNRVRLELLPLLRHRFQPALNQCVHRLMAIAGGEAEVVHAAARAWLSQQRPAFDRLAAGLQRKVLQLQLHGLGVAADFELIESLRSTDQQPVSVGAGLSVRREKSGQLSKTVAVIEKFRPGRLAFSPPAARKVVSFAGVLFDCRIDCRQGAGGRRLVAATEYFDAAKVGPQLVLRHWRPGDRFQPIGLPAAVKLQDWFTNQKVPRDRRRELIVATTAADEIFWVEGQRIGERFKLTAATKRRLVWHWRRL